MKSIITLIISVGFLSFTASCQRQNQSAVKELKLLDERNEHAKDNAMQGTVPEPKPAKDVIFH
ncbi:MAG: hypothetical protein V4584_00095 [Verrucomicrobiota bacterium]